MRRSVNFIRRQSRPGDVVPLIEAYEAAVAAFPSVHPTTIARVTIGRPTTTIERIVSLWMRRWCAMEHARRRNLPMPTLPYPEIDWQFADNMPAYHAFTHDALNATERVIRGERITDYYERRTVKRRLWVYAHIMHPHLPHDIDDAPRYRSVWLPRLSAVRKWLL